MSTVIPANKAEAGFFSSLFSLNSAQAQQIEQIESVKESPKEINKNSQTLAVLQAAASPDREVANGGGDITIENFALLPEVGPLGTAADIKTEYLSDQIVNYTIRKGDTLSGIGKMFSVSENTIIWANDLNRGQSLTVGDTLVILPVSGVEYTVKKGDTLKGIAKRMGADINEISRFNGITEETILAVGDTLIIPDGEISSVAPSGSAVKTPSKYAGLPEYAGYYMRPIIGGRKTQGIHGRNGVDLARELGAAVMASASGVVIVSRNAGWNGGYGKYAVVSHPNGTQTLYSHLNESLVVTGQQVSQGQNIGTVGSTGKSTGSHLHFEIRGAKNPF